MSQSIRRAEELTLNTAPALFEAHIDGWVVRASGTDTVRSNAATCLAAAGVPFEETHRRICHWFAQHQQAAAFRVSPITPEGVEAFLIANGYVAKDNTYFMRCASLAAMPQEPSAPPPGIRLVERSITDCLHELHRLKNIVEPQASREIARQANWRGPEKALALKSINGTLCLGMARIEGDEVGLFNIRTDPRHQGKGYATMLIHELLRWAAGQGASTAFLQVDVTNTRAVALYERVGFAPLYTYRSLLSQASPV